MAYVSDAGTLGVSDPGARPVAAVQAAGLRYVPLPGASSITTALSVAVPCPTAPSMAVCVCGFPPVKNAERANVIAQQLAHEPRCVVLLITPAPHRRAGPRPRRAGRAPRHPGAS